MSRSLETFVRVRIRPAKCTATIGRVQHRHRRADQQCRPRRNNEATDAGHRQRRNGIASPPAQRRIGSKAVRVLARGCVVDPDELLPARRRPRQIDIGASGNGRGCEQSDQQDPRRMDKCCTPCLHCIPVGCLNRTASIPNARQSSNSMNGRQKMEASSSSSLTAQFHSLRLLETEAV
jgi:hypothetical protein